MTRVTFDPEMKDLNQQLYYVLTEKTEGEVFDLVRVHCKMELRLGDDFLSVLMPGPLGRRCSWLSVW